jgi:hypothetical protein
MKIVLNKCYGGFSLSKAGLRLLLALKGIDIQEDTQYGFKSSKGVTYSTFLYPDTIPPFLDTRFNDEGRADPDLVKVVEILGKEANGPCADLQIEEFSTTVRFTDYDGIETLCS